MRRWLVISVLVVAGCGEHRGWNPNYLFRSSDYGTYLAKRETALMTGSDVVETIPITRPAKAPSASDIAGTSPVPIPATMRIRKRAVQTLSATTTPEPRYGSYEPPTLNP